MQKPFHTEAAFFVNSILAFVNDPPFGVSEKLVEPGIFLIPSNSMELKSGLLNFSHKSINSAGITKVEILDDKVYGGPFTKQWHLL